MTKWDTAFGLKLLTLAVAVLVSACTTLPELPLMRQADSAMANKARVNASQEETISDMPLIGGNKVTLLFDGPKTMKSMIAAIKTATDHIHLETYIFDQDELGLLFAELLIEKQKQGVNVSIMYDSAGTIGTPEVFFAKMRKAGIALTEFNPVNPLARSKVWRLNNRDHRKILIVDGVLAFTGGVNISNAYAKGSFFRSRTRIDKEIGWRDTHIKLEGPAVAALQTAFLKNWQLQNPEVPIPPRAFFPPLPIAGDKTVRILTSEPNGQAEIYQAYVLAIQRAKKSVYITAAYFAPDPQIIEALTKAALCGVDVKIILPGVSDSNLVFYAGHSQYKRLLKSGVRIFELQVAVLHAKTAVIDGNWSTVGSSNIDHRSFLHNHELNVVIMGEPFGNAMESAFFEDLKDSREITPAAWQRREWSERFREWSASLFYYWL